MSVAPPLGLCVPHFGVFHSIAVHCPISALSHYPGLVKSAHHVTQAGDGKPYTTMAYANGPGQNGLYNHMVGRQDLTNVNTCKCGVN